MEDLAHQMLVQSLTDFAKAQTGPSKREAEDRAAKWAGILTALHVHAEHERNRPSVMVEDQQQLQDAIKNALREAIGKRSK